MFKNLPILLFLLTSVQLSLSSQQIYDTSLPGTSGKTVTLGDLKGDKLTVIDFWATWCKPCLISIPELVKLSEEFDDKGVRFVGVSEDGPRNIAKVRPFTTSMGIPYPVLLDPDEQLMADMLINALPTLVILDSEGRVLYTHEGFSHGDETVIKDKLSSLLAEME